MRYHVVLIDTGNPAELPIPIAIHDSYRVALQDAVRLEGLRVPRANVVDGRYVPHTNRWQYRVLIEDSCPQPLTDAELIEVVQQHPFFSAVYRAGRHYEQDRIRSDIAAENDAEAAFERHVEGRIAAEDERIAHLPYPGEVPW